jgi:hypothetical protein
MGVASGNFQFSVAKYIMRWPIAEVLCLVLKKQFRDKLNDFIESTLDATFALASLLVDAGFWILWALATKKSSAYVNSFDIPKAEAFPYLIAQWTGSGILALFIIFRTLKDIISLWDNFIEFLKNRKNNRKL